VAVLGATRPRLAVVFAEIALLSIVEMAVAAVAALFAIDCAAGPRLSVFLTKVTVLAGVDMPVSAVVLDLFAVLIAQGARGSVLVAEVT